MQALVDGPSTGVARQSLTFKHMILTPYLLRSLPRAAGSATVKKQFEASDVVAKWEASAWAKKRSALERRKKSSDFERFEIMSVQQPFLYLCTGSSALVEGTQIGGEGRTGP